MSVVSRSTSFPVPVFDACSYFLPRLMFLNARYAPQVHWGDIVLVLRDLPVDSVNLSSGAFWREWDVGWETRGEQHVSAAHTSSTRAGRARAMRSAAACFHWAEFMQFGDADRKLALRRRVRHCFLESWSGELNATHGTVEGAAPDDPTVPFWLLMPPGYDSGAGVPLPCVILSNGLDSMSEVEILALAEGYLERGIAAVLFEGPGQGMSVGQMPLQLNMEAVVDQIAQRVSDDARIDGDRLGFVGVSFGGYFALRVAQGTAGRFRSVVNLSGGPWIAPFEGLPRRLKQDFSFAFQCDDAKEMQAAFDDLQLDLSRPPTANVLSIHGARDDIFPLAGLHTLHEAWQERHELVVHADEAHVCLNEINLVSLRAADWMAESLSAEPGPIGDWPCSEAAVLEPSELPAPESVPVQPDRTDALDEPRQAVEVPPRVWLISFVIVVGAFMTQLDASMVNIILAPLTTALHSTLQTSEWIVTAYLLGLVVGLPLCSWWARALGAGTLWLASLVGFMLASAACAAAPNAEILIAFRILQGLIGGLMLPAGQTVIAQAAGKERLGRVMSVVGTALVLAPALGPIVGSEVLVHLSWPWLFLVNLPVGGVALWIGMRTIPRGERGQPARFDMLGFTLVGFGLPLITYAISRSWQYGTIDVRASLWPLALGIAALAAFARHCRRTQTPLLKLELFSNPRFLASASLSFLVGLAEFGALVAWPLYFLVIEGFGLVHTGVAMLGFALGSAALPLSGRLTDKHGGGLVCLSGSVVLAAGYILAAAVIGTNAPFFALEFSLLLLGIGTAFTVVPTLTTAFVAVRPPEVPDAVAIVNILLRVGGAVGISLVVAVIGDQTMRHSARLSPFQDAFTMLAAIAVACGLAAAALIFVSRARRADRELTSAAG